MEVSFGTRSLLRCYEESAIASREWGDVGARRYIRLVNELRALPTFADLFAIVRLHVHPSNGRPGSYTLDTAEPCSLIVRQGERPDQVIAEEVTNHHED